MGPVSILPCLLYLLHQVIRKDADPSPDQHDNHWIEANPYESTCSGTPLVLKPSLQLKLDGLMEAWV